jgi:hypothetical protein
VWGVTNHNPIDHIVADATIVLGPRVGADKFAGAPAFWATTNRSIVPDDDSLDLATGMAAEAWVYSTSTSGRNTVVMKEQPNRFTYVLYANGNPRRPYGIIYSNGAEREIGGGGRID